MNENTFTIVIIPLVSSLVIAFIYSSRQSLAKLQQVKAFPSVLQNAGFHLFSNANLHESYRFLNEFKNNLFIENTLYAATNQDGGIEITAFAYSETRAARRSYPILVLVADLPHASPSTCIFTRNTRFGPITPSDHHIFKTRVAPIDKAYRITSGSESDFQSSITPQVQQFLVRNTDISHIEISGKTIALFTSDNRFFQLTTINGIPSPEVFSRRLAQLRELSHILLTKSYA